MRPIDQVTTLETSKKLQELGVKKESLFLRTFITGEVFSNWSIFPRVKLTEKQLRDAIPAYTASEIGEMLFVNNFTIMLAKIDGNYRPVSWDMVSKFGDNKPFEVPLDKFQHPNLAEAMGLVLVYLLENKIIEL